MLYKGQYHKPDGNTLRYAHLSMCMEVLTYFTDLIYFHKIANTHPSFRNAAEYMDDY